MEMTQLMDRWWRWLICCICLALLKSMIKVYLHDCSRFTSTNWTIDREQRSPVTGKISHSSTTTPVWSISLSNHVHPLDTTTTDSVSTGDEGDHWLEVVVVSETHWAREWSVSDQLLSNQLLLTRPGFDGFIVDKRITDWTELQY